MSKVVGDLTKSQNLPWKWLMFIRWNLGTQNKKIDSLKKKKKIRPYDLNEVSKSWNM
jgi:hypothetical protein